MIEGLRNFFQSYPHALLHHRRATLSEIPEPLQVRLKDYRERGLAILDEAQLFTFDEAAETMIADLILELSMKHKGDVYGSARLPFPVMVLIFTSSGADEFRPVGLITQDETEIYTQVFLCNAGGLVPSMNVLHTEGLTGQLLPTPTLELFEHLDPHENRDDILEQERRFGKYFLGMAVGAATLLHQRDMLQAEDIPVHTRAERRRAQREGRELPDHRKIVIRLGEEGRKQWRLMRDPVPASEPSNKRRAHRVRGHLFLTRSGDLKWRKAHRRGVGTIIDQDRRISGAKEENDN